MLTDKKLKRIEAVLDKDTLTELVESGEATLQVRIVQADKAIKQAEDELEANQQYLELRENIKALSQGMRDVKKRQNAIVQFSLHLIEEKGK